MPLKRSSLEKFATWAVRRKVSALVAIAAAELILCGPAGNTVACAQEQKSKVQNTGNTQSVDRGKYLVEAVPWLPAKPDSDWPVNAPRIGGTPLPASDADMIKLLTTGIWTTGNSLRPPMPQFRMSRSDAGAVVAYLKSLNPQP